MEYTEEEGMCLAAEFMEKLAARPVKGRYPLATGSATMQHGGKVICTSRLFTIGGQAVCVGDIVRDQDGCQACVAPGAGSGSFHDSPPMALLRSELCKGECISGARHDSIVIVPYPDQASIVGWLARSYVASRSQGRRA